MSNKISSNLSDDKANSAVINLLSDYLMVKEILGQVNIVNGMDDITTKTSLLDIVGVKGKMMFHMNPN